MVRDGFAYSAGLAGAELDGLSLSLLSLHLVYWLYLVVFRLGSSRV